MGCITALLAGCILTGFALVAGFNTFRSSPRLVQVKTTPPAVEPVYRLSGDQASTIQELGNPESFLILFYQEATAEGALQDIRFETWRYYTQGTQIIFRNGKRVAQEPVDAAGGSTITPTPYRPQQFSAEMNRKDILSAAGISDYLFVPLDQELLKGGALYYAPQLTFGMKDRRLVYLETPILQVTQ